MSNLCLPLLCRILGPSVSLGEDALRVVTDYEQVVENINLALNISTAANSTAAMAYQQVCTSVLCALVHCAPC